jgi:hypothetical protein
MLATQLLSDVFERLINPAGSVQRYFPVSPPDEQINYLGGTAPDSGFGRTCQMVEQLLMFSVEQAEGSFGRLRFGS